MKAIPFLLLVALFSIQAISTTNSEIDQCFTAFDLGPSDKHSIELTVPTEKITSLENAYISYNNCTNERIDRIECNAYRLILAPASEPASLVTIHDIIPEKFKNQINALESGDRVIMEGLNYTKGDETIKLKPIVFTIE